MNGLRRVLLIAVAAVFFMSFAVSAAAEDDTSDSSATVELTAAASEEVAEEIAEMTNTEAIVDMTTESTLAGQFAFTREEGLAWARAQLGQYIDVDGAYGAQCVDLIYAYYEYLGVGRRGGNGTDYQNDDKLPEDWTRLYASDGEIPQPADVVVWASYAPGVHTACGHVGIVDSVNDDGSFNVLEQNYGADRSVTLNEHKAGEFTCLLRPNWNIEKALENGLAELVKNAAARYYDN